MTQRPRLFLFGLLLVTLVSGVSCSSSGPALHSVSGTITHKGAPVSGAEIRFFPIETTEGVGGTGKTDGEGKYTVTYSRGGTGLPVGKYRVAISKRVMPDGSEPPADVEPMDSPASETLPPKYSDDNASELTATITEDGSPVDFALE